MEYILIFIIGFIFIIIGRKLYSHTEKKEEVEVIEEKDPNHGILITKNENGLFIEHQGFEEGEMVASLLIFSVRLAINGGVTKTAFKQLVDNFYKTEAEDVQQS